MPLDPSLKKLVELIAGLYPLTGDSYRLVTDADLRIEWIAFKDKGIDNWSSIFDEAKNRGKLTKLIEIIINERKDKPELHDAYRAYLGSVAQQETTSVNTVAAGLEALAKLIQRPEVHEILIDYRNTFFKASRKIDDMGNYKDLHDLLHELQVHCHDPIAQIHKRPRIHAEGWEDLGAHRTTLLRINSVLQNLSKKNTFKPTEMRWIEDFLSQALALLKQAIAKKNSKQIASATALINRVLDDQPPLINLCLNATARELQMSELALSMTVIRDKVFEVKLSTPEVQQFLAGVEDLINLSDALTAQLHVHDTWQVVDRDLRYIEAEWNRDLNALKSRWPEMKKNTALLYQNNGEGLAIEFNAASKKLDEAVDAGRVKVIKDAFREYRRLAIELFYVVDIKLKDFCGELRKIGGAPLSAVTNALHAAERSRS